MEKAEQKQDAPVQPAAPPSCRKKKSDPDASFIQDVKEHLHEFVTASMEDHKNCFINTFGKMFGKVPNEEPASSSNTPGVEGVLATTSK